MSPRLGSSQFSTIIPKDAGGSGQDKSRTCEALVELRGSREGQGGNDLDSGGSVDRDNEVGDDRDSGDGGDRSNEGSGSNGTNLLAPSGDLRAQASSKSKAFDALVKRRGSQEGRNGTNRDSERGGDGGIEDGKHRDTEGGRGSGMNLLTPSRDARGAAASECPGTSHLVAGCATTSNAPGGSHLARRNDSILKSLFSGSSPVAAGALGKVPGVGFSFEFGLWKNIKGAPSAAVGSRGGGLELALPPPPLQGFPQAGIIPYCPRADKDGVGAHETRGFSGRISLEAMSTTAQASGELVMGGRPSSPPPNQTCTGLSGVEKFVTSCQRNDERPLGPAGGFRDRLKTPNRLLDPFNTQNGTPNGNQNGNQNGNRDFETKNDVPSARKKSTMPVCIGKGLKADESGRGFDVAARDGTTDDPREGTREGTRDTTRDGVIDGITPPSLAIRSGKPPRRRQPTLVSFALQPPSAARSSVRSRANLPHRHESRSGLSQPRDSSSGCSRLNDSSSGRGGRRGRAVLYELKSTPPGVPNPAPSVVCPTHACRGVQPRRTWPV